MKGKKGRKMKNVKRFACFTFILMLVMLQALPIYAAENNKGDITKTYTYISKDKYGKDKDIAKHITDGGKPYRLKDVKYEVEPLRLKRDIKTGADKKFDKNIKAEVEGKEFSFVSSADIKWIKEAERKEITKDVEYINRADIPKEIQEGDYTLKLNTVEEKSRSENFTAPALFISYSKDATEYYFNGKRVSIGSVPVWEGYAKDINEYLGVNGANYLITGGSFTGENLPSGSADGHYERTAIYSGTRQVPYYLANFNYSGDDLENVSYKASVLYTSTDGYKVKATACYEKEGMSLKQKILVFSAGILVLAVAAAIVIVLAKRKKKEKKI